MFIGALYCLLSSILTLETQSFMLLNMRIWRGCHEQVILCVVFLADGPVLWRMLTYPPARRALIVGCGLHMFQQLSGINTVMYALFLSTKPLLSLHHSINNNYKYLS